MSILDTLRGWLGGGPRSVYETLAEEEKKILKDPKHPKYKETLEARLARDDKDDD
jgi:hypothetical protein